MFLILSGKMQSDPIKEDYLIFLFGKDVTSIINEYYKGYTFYYLFFYLDSDDEPFFICNTKKELVDFIHKRIKKVDIGAIIHYFHHYYLIIIENSTWSSYTEITIDIIWKNQHLAFENISYNVENALKKSNLHVITDDNKTVVPASRIEIQTRYIPSIKGNAPKNSDIFIFDVYYGKEEEEKNMTEIQITTKHGKICQYGLNNDISPLELQIIKEKLLSLLQINKKKLLPS